MASTGYQMSGVDDITGIDLNPQPHYPYSFIQADALDILESQMPEGFDLIHASPPCQMHTRAKHLRKAQGGEPKYLDLLTPTLELLNAKWSHKTWIVENVPGAPGMEQAVIQCGSAYFLGVRRHRLFLSNRPLTGSKCNHKGQGRPWGVYHVMGDSIPKGGRTCLTVEQGRYVMGVDREIPWDSLKEGFPPAYTHSIGNQIMRELSYEL